jgi:hypothetical protein
MIHPDECLSLMRSILQDLSLTTSFYFPLFQPSDRENRAWFKQTVLSVMKKAFEFLETSSAQNLRIKSKFLAQVIKTESADM